MIIQNPLTGRTGGSSGTAVFYTAFGKHLARTRPASYKRPSTLTRDIQEGKFAHVVRLSRFFLQQIRIGYHQHHNVRSPWASCISHNMHYMNYESGQTLKHSCLSFKVAVSDHDTTEVNFTAHFAGDIIQVDYFLQYPIPPARLDDYRVTALFCPAIGKIFLPAAVNRRADPSDLFIVPASLHDHDFVLQLFYTSEDYSFVETSQSTIISK